MIFIHFCHHFLLYNISLKKKPSRCLFPCTKVKLIIGSLHNHSKEYVCVDDYLLSFICTNVEEVISVYFLWCNCRMCCGQHTISLMCACSCSQSCRRLCSLIHDYIAVAEEDCIPTLPMDKMFKLDFLLWKFITPQHMWCVFYISFQVPFTKKGCSKQAIWINEPNLTSNMQYWSLCHLMDYNCYDLS